jgi:hypothetical protein
MKGITPYQLEILQHVAAADVAEPIDFDTLLAKLSWQPKKESAQFPIRACVTKGFLRKTELKLRRGRLRVCYEVTHEGLRVLDPRLAAVSAYTLSGLGSGSSGDPVVPEIPDYEIPGP